jgi:hypothetical protein
MKTNRKAQIATIIVLLLALALVLGRKRNGIGSWSVPAPPRAAAPQDTIYAMLDAAREGNVKKYLDCYAGQMLASLRQALAETGDRKFAQYLQDSNAAIKGVAVMEPQALTDREVKVRVEYVYQDRNEAQTMYLEKDGPAWKITRVEGVERVKTLVPYGTPVQ